MTMVVVVDMTVKMIFLHWVGMVIFRLIIGTTTMRVALILLRNVFQYEKQLWHILLFCLIYKLYMWIFTYNHMV